jgi:hypothetical protein
LAAWCCLPEPERRARLRCLQGLCRVFAGPSGKELTDALRRAETDIAGLADCDRQLDNLPTITRAASCARSFKRCRWVHNDERGPLF